MSTPYKIADLITKKIKGSITAQELEELEIWLELSRENRATYERAIDQKEQLKKLDQYNSFKKEQVWENIEKDLFPAPKVISLWSRKTLKYAAALLIPLMMASGAAYFFFNQNTEVPLATLDENVKPGVQKATLVLSNGATHILDPQKAESILTDADAKISNKNNALSYVAENDAASGFKPAVYNDLITPKGGGYTLQLADGTMVWLNADSKLSFPVAFTDSTRHIYLEGEAYFEVAHNGSPFIVTSGEMDIRVMGTSFNVSAYANDSNKKTTLVEGKVRVDLHNKNAVTREFLTPNKQAVVSTGKSQIVIAEVDASQYNSWVDGKLEFNNETLEDVLKKLARWYDFEYEFSNQKAKGLHFSGRLDNQEKISSILHMLEMTTNVKFEVEDDKIVVK